MMDNYGLKYIDSHIHPYFEKYSGKGQEIIRESIETGLIDGVIIAPYDWDSNDQMRYMFLDIEFGKYVYFAAGYHPKCVNSNSAWSAKEKTRYENWLMDQRTVAVKTGLSFENKKLLDLQKEKQKSFMRRFIDYANGEAGISKRKFALELHVRDATEEAIRLLREHPVKTKAEVHCFTYGYEIALKYMEVGVNYFGIGGHITLDDADDLREAVKKLPLTSLLLETDGPYKVPKGIDFQRPKCFQEGEVSTPLCLPQIAEVIANLKQVPVKKVAEQIYRNTVDFFGLK